MNPLHFPSPSGGRYLREGEVLVAGILNMTPDSFSDGGQLYSDNRPAIDRAVLQAENMVSEGATIIDVGGESTRPGAAEVSLQQEMDRVLPVVERLLATVDCVVSVDTSQPAIMRQAASLGCGLLNDVRALGIEGALQAAVESSVPVCLMHMQGSPASMQDAPCYDNVVDEVIDFLQRRVQQCMRAGLPADKLVIDPGFGFGKTLRHNLQLLNSLEKIVALGYPVLVGISRKSMLGQILDKPVDQRLYGGLATTCIAADKGASIIRTHDVAATCDVIRVIQALRSVDGEAVAGIELDET